MNKFFFDQIAMMERHFHGEIKKAQFNMESEKEMRFKIENNMKYNEDQVIFIYFTNQLSTTINY